MLNFVVYEDEMYLGARTNASVRRTEGFIKVFPEMIYLDRRYGGIEIDGRESSKGEGYD